MPSRAADFRTTPAFAGAAGGGARGLDCALTLCLLHVGRARPVSTPSRLSRAWLGVVMRCREEFAEFERIPIVVSGRSAQFHVKSAVSASSTIIPLPGEFTVMLVHPCRGFARGGAICG